MATTFCTACGRPVPLGGTFCPGCGASVVAAAPHGGGISPPPPSPYAAFGHGGPQDPRTTPEGRAAEGRGLRAVRIAMLLAVAGALTALLEQIVGRVVPFISVTRTGSGLDYSLAHLGTLAALLAAAAALTIAEIVALRIGFASLARVLSGESTPAALAIVALVGLIMVWGGIGLFLDALNSALRCAAGAQPIPNSCLLTGTLYGSIALLAIGGILGLIGYIGVLIGLYRIGDAYRDSTIKVGTILLIIPYVSLAGAILIGYRVGKLLDRQGGPVAPGSAP